MARLEVLKYLLLIALINRISADLICVQGVGATGPNIVCTAKSDEVLRGGLVANNSRTTEVILKHCHITAIEQDALNALPSLIRLDLSHNAIKTVNELFEETPNIKKLKSAFLKSARSHFDIIDASSAPTCVCVQTHTTISDNKIQEIKPKAFHKIPRLNTLDLSDNVILGRNLDAITFEHSVALEHLDVSGNFMTGTQENLLQAMQMIKTLNLNRCSLQNVPSFATRSNLNTMTRLELSTNEIPRLNDPKTFVSLVNLDYLDLAANLIESIHEDVFKPLKKLKSVLLQHNMMTQLPETLFTGLNKLGNIDLSQNLIEYVPVNAFRNTKLKNLNLSVNKFTYLQDNFCLELRNSGVMLKKFFFNQNPWQCECLIEILKEVKKFKIEYNGSKYGGKERVCVTTKEFQCKRHMNFNEEFVEMYNDISKK